MKKLTGLKSRLSIGIAILVTIFAISNGCTKTMTDMTDTSSDPGVPGINEVFIQGMAFNPVSISVAPGTTIKWTNKDAVAHTVTSNTSVFQSGNINNNGTFSFTFTTAGTFQYHCALHPSMTATVIVN